MDIFVVGESLQQTGIATGSEEAEQPLKTMVQSIKDGKIGNYLAFNRDGELVQLKAS